MRDTSALLILEVAYNLAAGNQEVMRDIAKAATNAALCGPIAVARFGSDAQLDRNTVHAIAQHLSVAWRIRASLSVADKPSAVEAALHEDGTSSNLSHDASTPTAREVLRRAVLTQEQSRIGKRSASDHVLWPALVDGRWSLLDVFTAAGTRYIVAHENPAEAEPLRRLSPREQRVLELTLAGGSGNEIGFDLRLSESVVTRTLRTALRKIGVADTAALAGVRTARFEPLEGLNVGVDLAIARLTPAVLPLASLSAAERAIVAGLLSGQRIAAIAHERGTSPRTVGNQISSIYRKLGISSRRELLALLI